MKTDSKIYSAWGKNYQAVGKILWLNIKPGDVYIGQSSLPYCCLTKAYESSYKQGNMKVRHADGNEFYIERSKSFQVYLLSEVPYENESQTQGVKAMEQLFKIKGTEHFGNVIATDSQGNKVFEIRGGGGIQVVKSEQIEEVFPFTFSVKFVNGNDVSYHFTGIEGQFKVGDLLIYDKGNSNIGLCVVTALDTKSRSATKNFSGYRLNNTEKI